jgi:hypothetical protein
MSAQTIECQAPQVGGQDGGPGGAPGQGRALPARRVRLTTIGNGFDPLGIKSTRQVAQGTQSLATVTADRVLWRRA